MTILDEIPLEKHTIDVALKLGEVILINGILFNSKAWQGITKNHIRELEKNYENLMQRI